MDRAAVFLYGATLVSDILLKKAEFVVAVPLAPPTRKYILAHT
jgi:hypothetical protein